MYILNTQSVFTPKQQSRGSAHSKAFAAQTHENRGRVPRFSYFKREKVSVWELSDVRVLRSQNTDCRKNDSFSTVSTEAHCPGFPFLCVAVPLGELLADELACGARRTAGAAQRKALSEQVQLVPFERKTALVGELLDDVQIFVLVRNGEGDLKTEAVGQGGDGFERVANADVIALTVGHALADEVAAVGGRVDDKVGRLAGKTALDERLEGREIVVLTVKGQVVEEYNKAERRAERLLEQFGEAGDMARRHLDDLEAAVGVLVGDRLDGRGFAGALVAVEQDVVRVLAVEEGAGVLSTCFFWRS